MEIIKKSECEKCFHLIRDPLGGCDTYCQKRDIWKPDEDKCSKFLTDKIGIIIFFSFWITTFSIGWILISPSTFFI